MNTKKRILVIDDEPSITRSLKLNLEASGGYEVRTVNNPRHALDVARKFQPDLVLLDVMMPEMDGGEVAAQLQANRLLTDVPIIFLTAILSNKETGGHEKISGSNTFLAKPVDWNELKACLAEHLGMEPQLIHPPIGQSGPGNKPGNWLD